MIHTTALLALMFTLTPMALAAQGPDADSQRHVRTTNPLMLRLIREGEQRSTTFRALIRRLEQSDVIVYLECGGGTAPRGGRLTFISAAGGLRYVQVHVAQLTYLDQQLAIIGHELRHAVEVADAPEVIDEASLAREYTRIGYVNPRVITGIAFDSDAAVRAGYQVLREITEGQGVLRLARGD